MPKANHFDPRTEYDVLKHRPHKTALHFLNALAATAMFRIWPILLFMGGWSTMVTCVNLVAERKASIPTTMITVLGVLLGLTLSYRTSSAYEKYSEGRRLWASITLASRNWARMVWIHCPDSLYAEPPTDPQERARDIALATVEKKTIVQLALAFAVSVKHYLRGEEGIMYDDLYYLVNFIPSLDLPSGLPESYDTNMAHGLPSLSATRPTYESEDSTFTGKTDSLVDHVRLRPSDQYPESSLSKLWPFGSKKTSSDDDRPYIRRHNSQEKIYEPHHGEGQNIPLEVALFMSSWVATIQRRKVVEVSTMNQLHQALGSLLDSLTSLERILTTPIPWSFNAHIWEVSWIYCLALPFQLIAGDFKWVTIPATIITTYIVMGYASIAEEIENPFGYDKNDLNLGYFCREIIAKELDAITARPHQNPENFIFTSTNQPLGPNQPPASVLINESLAELRARLAMSPAAAQTADATGSGSRTPMTV